MLLLMLQPPLTPRQCVDMCACCECTAATSSDTPMMGGLQAAQAFLRMHVWHAKMFYSARACLPAVLTFAVALLGRSRLHTDAHSCSGSPLNSKVFKVSPDKLLTVNCAGAAACQHV